MRTPIPDDVKARLSQDPRMARCVVADDDCAGRIQWHHAIIFGGQALQVDWAIHGICEHHHAIADRKDVRAKIVAVIHTIGGNEVKQYEKIRRL